MLTRWNLHKLKNIQAAKVAVCRNKSCETIFSNKVLCKIILILPIAAIPNLKQIFNKINLISVINNQNCQAAKVHFSEILTPFVRM